MSNNWDNNEKDFPQQPGTPEERSAPSDTADTPVPPDRPDAPVGDGVPGSPVAPDGSYRYVPPRASQAPQQPQQGGYPNQQPYQGGYPNQQPYGYGAPPTPPTPPKKNNKGWVTAVAILSVIAVLTFVIFGAFALIKNGDGSAHTDSGANVENGDNNATTPPVNNDAPQMDVPNGNDAPSLEIGDGSTYYDGGLTTEAIVSQNYHSTVVLTMYSKTTSFYFGESNLQEVGAASGIVWTKDGYVITNRHCVINESTGKKYDRVDVTTYDGTVYENATVIGADEATDLAVIKVDATDLTPAKFGDSDALAVGTRVVALGNAAGLSWTATQGILSAKARDVYDDTGYAIKCLQVDVAINSGNSGGPLLNKYGEVVGINSAKIAASGYEGLGFSIPINEAKVIINSLAKYGYVQGRVSLGITGQTVSSGVYRGFMIITIEQGSCLADTQAQVYDLIVAVDDVTVTDYGTLRAEMARHKVGDKVKLKLLRSNERTGVVTTHYVTVTLKEQTASQ